MATSGSNFDWVYTILKTLVIFTVIISGRRNSVFTLFNVLFAVIALLQWQTSGA